MNKIQQLIQQYCPNGVEFKELQEVFDIKNGYTPSKGNPEFWENGTIPWFRMEDIRANGRVLSDSIQHITPESVKSSGLFAANSIIVSTSATIGEHALITVDFLANQRFTCLTRKGNYTDRLDMLFFQNYMYLIDEWCKNNINISGFAGVDMPKFKKLQIPIPPIEVQQEIAYILDSFTQLEAELEAELEARRAQYAYYRAKLLNFNNKRGGYNWLTLRELCLKTDNMKWKENDNIDFKYIDLSSVDRMSNKITEAKIITSQNAPSRAQQIVRNNDVIFGTTRPTLKRYCLITPEYDGQICSTGFCVLRANTEMILPKYLFFVLTTSDFYNYVENNQEGAGYPAISNSKVKEYKMAVPSIEEQNRIVEVLDKFDSLVNDISIGLPAEIDGRRKQYNYYRGKLLDFKCVSNG
jgi:type I restriction enzyme S subunit